MDEGDRERSYREIKNSISAELSKSAEQLRFVVEKREPEGGVWKLTVDMAGGRGHALDELLEGSSAWWAGPPKGTANVLSVIPEAQQVNLRFATAAPPDVGGFFLIYPPRYLDPLRMLWSDASWAATCFDWLRRVTQNNAFDPSKVVNIEPFRDRLRARQAKAFELPGWDMGFLWGPPGTGKTYTLGRMLAQYLVQFPTSRVLLLSTTNSAVDQALVSVDEALDALGRTNAAAREARQRCARLGNHFVAKNYEKRKHLLPVDDPRLVEQMTRLEAEKPDSANVGAYDRWKTLTEQCRKAMRRQATDVLAKARLAAITTTRAVFSFEEVRAFAPYDLIVIDEASQVGLAHALALAPLGAKVMLAGDPNQLAPIVQSSHPDAVQWLGTSMFAHMDRRAPSTCLLNEQSRMAEPICRIVSNVFYDRELVVAKECEGDRAWHRERDLASVAPMGTSHTHLELLAADGTWSQNYHGPIRQPGSLFVVDVVDRLTARGLAEEDVLVLTPFRAQRVLIRQKLRNAGHRHVVVNTVHRSQGSERHTVIFDPTIGDSDFLKTADARRLVNVALSRAKARLIVIMSPGDLANPLLKQIANLIKPVERAAGASVEIGTLVVMLGFPHCAVGKIVRSGRVEGRVIEVAEAGEKIVVADFETGLHHKLSVPFLREKYGVAVAKAVLVGGRTPTSASNPAPPAAKRTPRSDSDCCMLLCARRTLLPRIADAITLKFSMKQRDLFEAADKHRAGRAVPVLLYDAHEGDRLNIGWPVRWRGWYCGHTFADREIIARVEEIEELPEASRQKISSLVQFKDRDCTPMRPSLICRPPCFDC